jgi:hypothetical protein
MLSRKSLKDIDSVKKEIYRIVNKQKIRGRYDFSSYRLLMIKQLVESLCQFNPEWLELPVVARIARVKIKLEKYNLLSSKTTIVTYREDLVLPDTKHDLELVVEMLNYMRKQKKLRGANNPLFIQPDEIFMAFKQGKFSWPCDYIESQMVVIFQKGSMMHVGFVLGNEYFILDN